MIQRGAGSELPTAVRVGRAATVPAYVVCSTFAVIAPLALTVGMLLPAILLHESLALVAPLNLLAFRMTARGHGDPRPLRFAIAGVALILVHLLGHVYFGDYIDPFADAADPSLVVKRYGPFLPLTGLALIAGGVLLLVGTVMELRARRRGRGSGAATVEEHWRAILTGAHPDLRRGRQLFGRIPAHPRCKLCHAPFAGLGGALMRLLGKGPSDMNPLFCADCLSKTNLGGAEVELSMLFADVRGSTAMAERISPSEFTRILNRFYAAATGVLVRTDALIDKLVGDEVIGLYVPGYAGAEHARLAVEAAEELLRATGHADPGGPWLPIGIGVHTGVAFVGAVGTEGGVTDVTALGDAVNTAARLVGVAGPGEVLVSAAAAAAAGLSADTLERRQLDLKGRSEPVEVRVLRVAPAVPAPVQPIATPGP